MILSFSNSCWCALANFSCTLYISLVSFFALASDWLLRQTQLISYEHYERVRKRRGNNCGLCNNFYQYFDRYIHTLSILCHGSFFTVFFWISLISYNKWDKRHFWRVVCRMNKKLWKHQMITWNHLYLYHYLFKMYGSSQLYRLLNKCSSRLFNLGHARIYYDNLSFKILTV